MTILFTIINSVIVILIILTTFLILINTLKRKFKIYEVILWTVGSLFLFPIVQIIYYFVKVKNIRLPLKKNINK